MAYFVQGAPQPKSRLPLSRESDDMRRQWLCLILALGLLLAAPAGCHHPHPAAAQLGVRPLSSAVPVPHLPAPPRPAPRADARLRRSGRAAVHGNPLTILPSFSSPDGAYDLAIHFHGNPDAVAESYRRADINAVLVIVNLGAGATRYVNRFCDPTELEAILRGVDAELTERGLAHPHRRRLALSAWSAGYGAVLRVLGNPATSALPDAVLLLDGLHARRMPVTGRLDEQDLDPFAAFAARAADRRALLVITHSNIEPEGPIVSADDCTNHVLDRLGVERRRACGHVAPSPLAAAHAVYAERHLWPLELRSVARRGGLIAKAYEGRAPEHHVAHLFQMELLVLDDLRRWWA